MNMIRSILGKIQPVLYKGIQWYYAKPRILTKNGVKIHLLPSVFHPSLYLSTDIFLDYLLTQDIGEKRVLELGAGNGYISLSLAKFQHCTVTSSDINPAAIQGLKLSNELNQTNLNIIQSNLFDSITEESFDYILVNPPYYAKAIESDDEYAFFGGEKLEYFDQFFTQIQAFLVKGSQVLMILSETAPIELIKQKGLASSIKMDIVFQKKKLQEQFIIYWLTN